MDRDTPALARTPEEREFPRATPSALADTAIAWFRKHVREWPTSARRTRWDRSENP